MYKFLLVLCLTINVSYGAAGKLAEVMLNTTEFSKLLAKYGILGADAKEFQKGVSASLAALGDKKTISRDELSMLLSKLPVTGNDASSRKVLQVLLDSPVDKIKKEDIVNAVNNLISLADRYGSSAMFTCSRCVSDSEAKHGLKLGVSEVTNSSVKKLLNTEIPKNPTLLNSYITTRMKKLGMGDYGANVTPDTVGLGDEKLLAIYLGLAEKGSADQKALATAIKKLSTKNGKTKLIDPKNQHKFWKIMSEDMSDRDMREWTEMLNEVSARAQKDGVSPEEAWNRTLKEKAQGDPTLTKLYETLKAKKCFFI
jgi:hypothetical protein